jgi:hypothetical protein
MGTDTIDLAADLLKTSIFVNKSLEKDAFPVETSTTSYSSLPL